VAAFSWVIDLKGYRKWAFPLVVIGMNSIAAYMIAHLCDHFMFSSFRIHGPLLTRFLNRFVLGLFGVQMDLDPFRILGPGLEPLLLGAAVLFSYWLLLDWMYKRKLFLKI